MNGIFVEPGALRTELALEEAALQPDGMGGHGETWSETGLVFARVEPVRVASLFGAGQSLETVTHRITMRYREGLRSGMRLKRRDRHFVIETVHDPDETGRYLVCMTREEGR